MEFLTQAQIDQYKEIINEIKAEVERTEVLKQRLTDETTYLALARLSETKLIEETCRVFVEVYHDLYDLLQSFEDGVINDLENISKLEKCHYYVIRICISDQLHTKLKDRGFKINILIEHEFGCIYKTVDFYNIELMYYIIPVDEKVVDSVVEVTLVQKTCDSEQFNSTLLCKEEIDISYHFQRKEDIMFSELDFLKLAKLYNNELNISEIQMFPIIEYVIPCDPLSRFAKILLINSYEKLDLQSISELRGGVMKIALYTGINMCGFKLEEKRKICTIKATIDEIHGIKKHFIKNMKTPGRPYAREQLLNNIRELVKHNSFEVTSISHSLDLYQHIRKLWVALPM